MNYYYRPHCSPIDALPVELLAYIFVLGTHGCVHPELDALDQDDCLPFDSESVKTPLVYSSVSRHWRAVALNTPALYTSICITPELLRDVSAPHSWLDTTHIESYLALSRTYPVDILIDARDQEWDWRQDEPLFSAKHMHTAMTLLLRHIRRWRSLCVLTDVYAPMHAALRPLEGYLLMNGAPRLESLRLMHCNAYVAHAPAAPAPWHKRFLASAEPPLCGVAMYRAPPLHRSVFPRLRALTLRGVPAFWSALGAALPSGLRALEISYLPVAEQPSQRDLARILAAAPQHLARLVLNGAGPVLGDDIHNRRDYDDGYDSPDEIWENLSRLNLAALTVGYTSEPAALAILDMVSSAQNSIKTLTLEDASDPGALLPAPVDATPLLARLFPYPKTCDNILKLKEQPAFPRLHTLTLRKTHLAPSVSAAQIRVTVPRVELVDLPFPSNGIGAHVDTNVNSIALDCAELCVRGVDMPTTQGADAVLLDVLRCLRFVPGAAPRLVELHEAPAPAQEDEQDAEEFVLPGAGTHVRVVRRSFADEGEDGDEDTLMGSEDGCGSPFRLSKSLPQRAGDIALVEMDMDAELALEDAEDAAFAPGGVFNDAAFDARYATVGLVF
ncbi:hypothetical protein C8J57DRAFT_1181726 [Mycena rebaudengoi]|nr:hypothetical protein C8J57DRAFT_1181726 [Mycena rebaudengoi]